MRLVSTIAGAEFRRMFYSPLAWSILAIIQGILAYIFLHLVNEFGIYKAESAGSDEVIGVTDFVVEGTYLWAGIIMLAVMPILTMRLFAEERVNGTFSLLRSSPVSITEIVLGKYFGLMLFILLMIALISLMPLSLYLGTALDWGKLFSAVLGLVLLLGSFAAAGLFISSLAHQPIIAAIGGFGLLLFLLVLFITGSSQSNYSEVFVYISHFGHFLSFLKGVFKSGDLVYYLLFILGFLVLTIRKLDNERLQR